jgi:dipeptidyl aminopeptidase/acylaminoacyl peptidase
MTDKDEEMRVFKEKSPLHMLDKTKGYPPTWFLHGENDSVVPIQQAYGMQEKLKELGIETGTSYEPGQGHEFDNKYTVSLASFAFWHRVRVMIPVESMLIIDRTRMWKGTKHTLSPFSNSSTSTPKPKRCW